MYRDIAEEVLHLMEQLPKNAPQTVLNELSRGELFILSYLHFHDSVCRPLELSAAMGTSSARTAAALGNMEKKGWIRRKTDEADRRHTLVYLTGEGSLYIEEIRGEALENMRLVLDELGADDSGEYLRILKRMNEIVTRRQGEPGRVIEEELTK